MGTGDAPDQPQSGEWLPPEPPGGGEPVRPAPPQPPPQQPQQPQQPAWGQPPPAQQPYGYGQQSPYGYGAGYGYGQPPYQQQWSQAEPDNTPGVAGFILSVTSLGTLVLFFGVLSFLNIPLSIAGAIVSRTGVKKVERGETRKHKDLSQWGYWLGIAGIVLSVLALAAWIAVLVSDPSVLDELDDTEPR